MFAQPFSSPHQHLTVTLLHIPYNANGAVKETDIFFSKISESHVCTSHIQDHQDPVFKTF